GGEHHWLSSSPPRRGQGWVSCRKVHGQGTAAVRLVGCWRRRPAAGVGLTRCILIWNFSIHRNQSLKKFQPPRPSALSALSPSLKNLAMMLLGHWRACIYQAV